ncbi:hypothetical protein ACQR07_01845 [Bradyrhizobium sp. HKCCYLS20291]
MDFRKQTDGLAAIVQVAPGGTKQLEDAQFRRPPIADGMIELSAAQCAALLGGDQ